MTSAEVTGGRPDGDGHGGVDGTMTIVASFVLVLVLVLVLVTEDGRFVSVRDRTSGPVSG